MKLKHLSALLFCVALVGAPLGAEAQVAGPGGASYVPQFAPLPSNGGTLTGPIVFSPDNTFDIGASGLTRPRNLYLGGSIFVNSFLTFTSASKLTSPADGQLKCTNNAGGAACSVLGTATNDNAVAGAIGEYICAQVTNGGSPAGCATNTSTLVGLTTNTVTNITSISLTAGDWEACGSVVYVPAGTTPATLLTGSVSTVSAAEPTLSGNGALVIMQQSFGAGLAQQYPTGCTRVSVASTTSVFLTIRAGFTVSTASAGGFIWARRLR